MLSGMIDGNPDLRAALQEALGVQPWPYTDLQLRCPHCPVCGDPGQMLVGGNVQPMAWCTNDACEALTWAPHVSAKVNLDGSARLVAQENPDGSTTLRPEHPEG